MTRVLSRAAAVLLATDGLATIARAQSDRHDALANSAMVENRPTPETRNSLASTANSWR